MLAPKKTKYRKWQNGRKSEARRNVPETRGVTVAFGAFGLKSMTQARITSNQIEAARKALSRAGGKTAKIWIRIFPHTPVTKKPQDVKMGSGKGSVEYYIAQIKAGRILYEMTGVTPEEAKQALNLAASKLPIRTKLLFKSKDPWGGAQLNH